MSVSATSKSCALNSASKGYISNARKIKLSNWKIVYGGPTFTKYVKKSKNTQQVWI